jgi:hypothetical protein
MNEQSQTQILANSDNAGYNQQTLFIPFASPPTPAPSPGPVRSQYNSTYTSPNLHTHPLLSLLHATTDSALRRQFLLTFLRALSPSDLLFVSQTIAPLLKRDFLSDLPAELALYVLSFVEEPRTLCRAMRVCQKWYAVIRDESLWRRLCGVFGFRSETDGKMGLENARKRASARLRAPPLAVSSSNSSTSSNDSVPLITHSKAFSWRRHFRTSYIIRTCLRFSSFLSVFINKLSRHKLASGRNTSRDTSPTHPSTLPAFPSPTSFTCSSPQRRTPQPP